MNKEVSGVVQRAHFFHFGAHGDDSEERPAAVRGSPQLVSLDAQSPVPGRSVRDDIRVCVHEASHALLQRIKNGIAIGGLTAQPDGFASGSCWSPKYQSAHLNADDGDVPELCAIMLANMPRIGENIMAASDIYALAHARVCELVAGTEGERLFLPGEPWLAISDENHARAHASMVTCSAEGILKFVDFCRAEASALLSTHEHVVLAIARELRIRRTLDGEQVDAIITGAVAAKTFNDERQRRASWAATLARAAAFEPETG